jgi:adenine-specific DNA-methyltransferase
MAKAPKQSLSVETLKHEDATRKNIPTAEYQSVMKKEQQSPVRVAYPRERDGRNRDLDPQLVWRGKDEQDWSDLVVHAPPLYIQEKVHPKVLIDDLKRQTERAQGTDAPQVDMFADFNGLPSEDAKTEFYAHDAHWANRMILGDSLAVMASLAEREGLRGKVQCIYFDPPYGIKFNSNFQWSTTSRDVKDGNAGHITREPEQVKAFRDTWRDGIHSYLTYLRDRLTVARDLLTDSGSIFVQIGEENVHVLRALLDEVFGSENCVRQITVQKTHTAGSPSGGTSVLAGVNDYVIWYAKKATDIKYRQLFQSRDGHSWVNYDYIRMADGTTRRMSRDEKDDLVPLPSGARVYRRSPLTSSSSPESARFPVVCDGAAFTPGKGGWKTNALGMARLASAGRLESYGSTLAYRRYTADFPLFPLVNLWTDTARGGYGEDQVYVVQTGKKVIARCILMTTDPGDLVLDPTCGSGTTAYVAEEWGRRWVTIDTSRVALALARARIMGARYPYFLLSDSRDGQLKEAEISRTAPSNAPTRGNVRHGFVYERAPHITLKSIANDAEVDVLWEKFRQKLEPLLETLNKSAGTQWNEWEVPRAIDSRWSDSVQKTHSEWWSQCIARQEAIDASIYAKAEFEYLFDTPY